MKKLLVLIFLFLLLSLNNSGAFAQSSTSLGSWGNPPPGASLFDLSNFLGSGGPNNAPQTTFGKLISTFISLLIMAGFILSLVFLILGGANWMMSRGDKQKLTQARDHVVFAVIGLDIVLLSFIVIRILGSFFGLNFLNLP